MGGLDDAALDFWIEPETLPTEVVELSDADEAAVLAAMADSAAIDNTTEARHLLRWFMVIPGRFMGRGGMLSTNDPAPGGAVFQRVSVLAQRLSRLAVKRPPESTRRRARRSSASASWCCRW